MTRAWRRWLAGAAALAGALAPFAGSPYRGAAPAAGHLSGPLADRGARDAARQVTGPTVGEAAGPTAGETASQTVGTIDVAELARAVADQEDHVSAVELAGWLRARRLRLRVVDVRSAAEFAIYHIPGAEHVPLEALTAARFAADETIVLYSELGVHGAQAWVFLRALGHRHVVFLRNGLHDWLDDVMSPTIAADAPAEARAAFDRVAELSRWFGGTPRRIDHGEIAAGAPAPAILAGAAPAAAGDAAPAARRRGC